MNVNFRARLVSEFIGTAFLLAAVVGSGIMGERLAGGNIAIALLANAVATGAVLVALVLAFEGISGAHFNPVVTLAAALLRQFPRNEVPGYAIAQILGGLLGVAVAHLMFALPLFSISLHRRSGSAQVISEFVATFGLVIIVFACSRLRPASTPLAVGAYITAAYWFTASTSFANPAVTLARVFTNTFTGIRAKDAPAFFLAQFAGGWVAMVALAWLVPALATAASETPGSGIRLSKLRGDQPASQP
jgi:glycerol uptake facilitator-like aquaporin